MTTSIVPVQESSAAERPPDNGYTEISRGCWSSGWVDVCPIDKILPDTGVCALVDDDQIAIFHLGGGEVYAIGNLDPFSNAAVLSRGIIGDHRGIPKVSSPVYKQSFDLRSGTCLDHDDVRVPVYRARIIGGIVQVGASPIHRGDSA